MMGWLLDITWWKDKMLPPVLIFVIAGVVLWLIGLLTLPTRLSQVEERVKTLDSINSSVSELKGSKDLLLEASKDAGKNAHEISNEILKLSSSNAELKAGVENLKTATADIRDLRKSIDELRMNVGNLDVSIKRNSDVITNLAKIVGGLEKGSLESHERTFMISLDSKHLIEAGNGVWEFRVPVPEATGPVARIVRGTVTQWPPELADVVVEYQQKGQEIRIILQGTSLEPAKRAILDKFGGIPVQLVIAVAR
jgi:predicted nuclease with TOPRIM domain